MRLSRLASLLTGCAVLALSAPAVAQDAPLIIIDPPLAPQPAVIPGVEPIAPNDLLPPLVVPAEDSPALPEVAETPPIPAVWAPVPFNAGGESAYGLYLSGRLASLRGDYAEGSELFSQSQALVPEQPLVTGSAVWAGLQGGDLETVARISPTIQNPDLAEVGRLAEIVAAVQRGDARAGLAILQAGGFSEGFEPVARFLRAPVAAAAGDWETALAPVVLTPGDPVSLVLLQQRAQLLEGRRRYDEAEADYQTLLAVPVAAQLFGRDYAGFLKRRGRHDEVLAWYETALAAAQGPASTAEARELARASAPALNTPVELAAHALRFGAIYLGGRPNTNELAAIYLRLSEHLHADGETALFLGTTLTKEGREGPAREAFGRVGPDAPTRYANAQFEMAMSFAREERTTDALAALQRARAAAPGQPQILRMLAAQLIALDRNEEALAVLDAPDANAVRGMAAIREMRAAALQNLDRTEESEAELWAALQSSPDDASLLNQLGYLWVDSGRRVDQGAEMLARAHAAEPDNGSIQDSLGWAQFRQGQYELAVETLEGAVNKLPANAVIVDHLGDAYWQVGRRREAEWQWSRVLTLDPDPEQRAQVEQKLAKGLSVDPPVSAGQF